MRNIGYHVTDWIFFFSKENSENIDKIFRETNDKYLKDEFVTWKLITCMLPLVPFIFVLAINILTNLNSETLFYSFVNNGSLPIISFGIISSGMPYLLEKLGEFPEYHSIRRRIMVISIIFLFLSSALYIVQTLYILSLYLTCISNALSLFLSLYIYLFSNSIGYKMFILQSKNIPSFDEKLKEKVEDLRDAISDL